MTYPKAGHYIDTAASRIVSVEEVSRRRVGDLNEADALDLLDRDNVTVFLHTERGSLIRVDGSDRAELRRQMVNHVANKPEIDPTDFESGYCFIAERWMADGGVPILVLHYHH